MDPNPLLALLPLATFSLVMSITPGPNNFMLLASGARFGLRRSLPHALGVTAGFAGLLVVAYAGVAAIVLAWPAVSAGLTVLCALYLFALSAQLLREAGVGRAGPVATTAEVQGVDAADTIARADTATTEAEAARPQHWIEAALFQLVNPKAWGMAVAAVAMMADVSPPASTLRSLGSLVVVCALVNLPCILVWTVFGAALRRALARAAARRLFNLSMAALVAGTATWMLIPLLPPAAR